MWGWVGGEWSGAGRWCVGREREAGAAMAMGFTNGLQCGAVGGFSLGIHTLTCLVRSNSRLYSSRTRSPGSPARFPALPVDFFKKHPQANLAVRASPTPHIAAVHPPGVIIQGRRI